MKNLVDALDWDTIKIKMHDEGHAVIPGLLSDGASDSLKDLYVKPELYRKTVVMERHRFGKGAYKYFNYPLPGLLQSLREHMYPHLASIANFWSEVLNLGISYPNSLMELSLRCQEYNQTKPTVLILKYEEAGFNTMHQDLYGEVYFPIQMVFFLSQPEQDYLGGEFVITEQVPRAQSKATVLRPSKGDALLLTTNFRPVKGARGYFRANMRHGVSKIITGERYTLGIIFHDALN